MLRLELKYISLGCGDDRIAPGRDARLLYVDDFCQQFEQLWQHRSQLPSMLGERCSRSRLSLSEVMTVVNAFHGCATHSFGPEVQICSNLD